MTEETKPEDTEAAKNEKKTKSKQGFPKRYVIVLMLFLGLATQYALRVNINIAITAMTNNHTVKRNGFTVTKVILLTLINRPRSLRFLISDIFIHFSSRSSTGVRSFKVDAYFSPARLQSS